MTECRFNPMSEKDKEYFNNLNLKCIELKNKKINNLYFCLNNYKSQNNTIIYLPKEIQQHIIEYADDIHTNES